MPDRVTFTDCVRICIEEPGMLEEFDRLHGTKLVSGTPIERMVDDACGKRDDDLALFVAFVREYVWLPALLDEEVSE